MTYSILARLGSRDRSTIIFMLPLPILVVILAVTSALTAPRSRDYLELATTPTAVSGGRFLSPVASLPGVDRLLWVDESLWCGAAPTASEGLPALYAGGVRTLISVDGAVPPHETATALGMRYIHIPLSYGHLTDRQRGTLAAAVASEKEGAVYLHCHHGRHRSAAAAAVAAIGLDRMTREDGFALLTRSETSVAYDGLWTSVKQAEPLGEQPLLEFSRDLPAAVPPKARVALMIEAQVVLDALCDATPPERSAEAAARLAEALRAMQSDVFIENHGPEYARLLTHSWSEARRLEALLEAGAFDQSEQALQMIVSSCLTCHRRYRR